MTSCDTHEKWWRAPTFWAVMLLAFANYCLRVNVFPVFGEEPRRGVIAREMRETGDWIVPRVQGVPRLSRPPLQNWLIAAVGWFRGSIDVWAVRVPSLAATLLTVMLVYIVAHRISGQRAAFLAGCAYATMYQVLVFGRLGETEALFTMFVSGSLLVWYLAELRGRHSWFTWAICYLLVAGGMLTKGLQAPVYFAGAVGLTLLRKNRWRELLQPAHLGSLVVGMSCVAAWQIAFIQRLGWRQSWMIYVLNVTGRFDGSSEDTFLGHLVAYPIELFAVMLPWSLVLLAALNRQVRERLIPNHDAIWFLILSCVWAFVFVWLPPGSRTRYFMPLMPCVAVLIGLMGDASMYVWRPNWTLRASAYRIGGVTVALTAIYLGPVMSLQSQRCDDIAGQIAVLKSRLPAGAQLSSLQQLHHSFLYYFDEPIRLLTLPEESVELPADLEYFAIHTYCAEPGPLPFDWELVGMVSCDRYVKGEPRDRIYIGRISRPTPHPFAN